MRRVRDLDENMGLMQGMYGTMDAELEMQRTIKRAELTTFSCLLRKAIGPAMVKMWTTKESLMVWGELKCGALAQERRTPTCGF